MKTWKALHDEHQKLNRELDDCRAERDALQVRAEAAEVARDSARLDATACEGRNLILASQVEAVLRSLATLRGALEAAATYRHYGERHAGWFADCGENLCPSVHAALAEDARG